MTDFPPEIWADIQVADAAALRWVRILMQLVAAQQQAAINKMYAVGRGKQ